MKANAVERFGSNDPGVALDRRPIADGLVLRGGQCHGAADHIFIHGGGVCRRTRRRGTPEFRIEAMVAATADALAIPAISVTKTSQRSSW